MLAIIVGAAAPFDLLPAGFAGSTDGCACANIKDLERIDDAPRSRVPGRYS